MGTHMNAADWANKQFHDGEYQKCVDMAYPQQKDPDVLFYAALALDKLEKKSETIAMLRRALFHKPDHEGVLRSLAWASEDDIERLAILEKMARLDHATTDDVCLMGDLYNRHNRLNEAHYWFQVALEKDRANSLAKLGLSEIHIKLAIRYLQQIEDEDDIDLSQQMSDEWDAEEVMRFVYDNITRKKSKQEEDECFIPTA
jgi:tetratricopeptide (TPR) repeat protein